MIDFMSLIMYPITMFNLDKMLLAAVVIDLVIYAVGIVLAKLD